MSTHSESVETGKDGVVHHHHKHRHEHTINVGLDLGPKIIKRENIETKGVIVDGNKKINWLEHVSLIGPNSEWYWLKNF